jgi:hypothetical protein
MIVFTTKRNKIWLEKTQQIHKEILNPKQHRLNAVLLKAAENFYQKAQHLKCVLHTEGRKEKGEKYKNFSPSLK